MADTVMSDGGGGSSSSSAAAQSSSSRVAPKRTPHLAGLTSRDDTTVRRTRSRTSTDATAAFISLAPLRRSRPSASSIAKSLATRAANTKARAMKRTLEKAKREAALKAAVALVSQPLPSHWDVDPTGSMLIRLDAKKNSSHASELQSVIQLFKSTAAGPGYPTWTITRVERIQNPLIYRTCAAKKVQLLAANPSHSVDVDAWHNTKSTSPQLIVQGGFDPSKGVIHPGHLYFSKTSGFSASDSPHKTASGELQIILVKLAPLSSETSGNLWTVGDSARMLPEHLITFKVASLPIPVPLTAAAILAQPLPSHWDSDPTGSMLIELDANKNPKHAAEFQAVTQRFNLSSKTPFFQTAEPFVVTRVHRIQNPTVHRAYQTKKTEVLAVTPGHPVDVLSWHGTKLNVPQSIVKNGFDISKGVVQPKSLWFSQYSGYSANGFRHQLSSGEGQIFSVKLCPTVSESAKAGMYIVGDSARMLPEHLITFKVIPPPVSAPLTAAAILAQPLPSHWDADSTGRMLIELDAKNPKHAAELQAVTQRFDAALSRISPVWTVTRVHRIQNPTVYRTYQARKAQLLAANPSYSVDVDAWHNSKLTSPQLIAKGGFDPSKGVAKAGYLWFTKPSGFSAHASAHKTASGEMQIISMKLCLLPSENAGSTWTVSEAARMLPMHVITYA